MRPITILSIVCLLFLMCCPLCAQNTKKAGSAGDNNAELVVEKAEKFARPTRLYSYIIYDKAIPSNLGIMSQRVKQRIPESGGSGDEAVPVSEPAFRQSAPERIPQPYELFRPGKTIVVKSNAILLHDEITARESVLIDGPDVSELRCASKFARTALSPNGRQIVVALLRVEDYNGISDFPLYDIYVVDLFIPVVSFPRTLDQIKSGEQYKPKLIREAIPGEFAISSSLLPNAIAPPLFWADDETVILITPKERPGDGKEPASDAVDHRKQFDFSDAGYPVIVVKEDEFVLRTHALVGIKVESCVSQEYFELKLNGLGWGNQSVDFWRRSDGAIMLRNSGKDIRIDLEKHEAIEDRRLSPNYELRGDRYQPSLWSGEELLCDSVYFRNVGVSPDGQCVAWYARSAKVLDKTNLGNTSQYLTTLWYHSPDTGIVEMAEGKFVGQDQPFQFDNPQLRSLFRWESAVSPR